jgi:hypothetical protein
MSINIQNYRSLVSGEAPEGLLPGQVAFNLADMVQFIGYGGDVNYDVDGNPVLPAPPAGEGWKAYPLSGGGGGSVTSVTGVSPISVTNSTTTPEISVGSASTTALGVVQLNDTTTSTSTTQALTANQGKVLQDQISALAVSSNLTFAGTIDGSTGFMLTVTTEGAANGFAVGSAMPAAAVGNAEYFAIVTVSGTMTPPGGSATLVQPGDWWLSDGSAYVLINAAVPSAAAATPSTLGTVYGSTTDANFDTLYGQNAGVALTTGGANTLIGYGVACALTTGCENVMVGSGVGFRATTARNNTLLGTRTGACLVAGNWNTHVGNSAGFFAEASCNTFIGSCAGICMCGSNSVAIGWRALRGDSTTTGVQNIAIGQCALFNITGAGSFNTALGGAAGLAITSGSFNVALGFGIDVADGSQDCQLAIGINGLPWLTGDNTFAIKPGAGIIDCAGSCGTAGQILSSNGSNAVVWATPTVAAPTTLGTVYALSNNTSNNVALGFNAGKSITTGGNNTFIGENAGCSNLGAFSITAIGLNAGCALVNGNNTVIGVNSGRSLVSGNFNLLVGEASGCSLVTGTSNTHIGQGAGTNDVSSYNTFIGHEAGMCSTAGCYNVAVGQSTFAQVSITTASTVTAIGQGALRQTSGGGGCSSVAVGTNAGCQVTTGINNTLIGCGSGINLTTGSNNVAIGFNARVASPSGNCQLVIGNNTSCWLTGNSTFAIRPGAGIIDCAGSCGTAGQVLMSNGSNAVCWGATPTPAAATAITLGTLYGCDQIACSSVYIGNGAGLNGTACSNNTALGNDAMGIFTGGVCTPTCVTGSIAIGQWALATASTQGCVINTIAIGNRALGSGGNPASGCENVFIGNCTGINKGSGDFNVVVGSNAATSTWGATCGCNTIVGYGAGSINNGSNNTVIGFCAQPATNASNSVTLGNASVTAIRAAVTSITAISDARDKTDVTALPIGLDFINSLNPVKFTWQMREPNEIKDGTSEAGFIAQELLAAQEEVSADYLGLVSDIDPEHLEASPGKLIPVLVKAIQELSVRLETTEYELAEIKSALGQAAG